MKLGEIRLGEFLTRTNGEVYGKQISDAKDRYYSAKYEWKVEDEAILISREGRDNFIQIPAKIDLNETLIAFFGLYSGDGAKGSEDPNNLGKLQTAISFSQREPNLVRFAVNQFRKIFPNARFTFSLGEDSAYFMGGDGLEQLQQFYQGTFPATPDLQSVRQKLNTADGRYLKEKRRQQANAQDDLSFYYFHKEAMATILTAQKESALLKSGVELTDRDKVTASLRRPYKKGARQPGGSSRSDETHVGDVTGMGELFLKILHEIESSLLENTKESPQGLIVWNATPDEIGQYIEVEDFFLNNVYGQIGNERPEIMRKGNLLEGKWARSKKVTLNPTLLIDPLWCYTAGLYLAEGSSPKHKMFSMYAEKPSGFQLGFTSSENNSLEFTLKSLQKLFPHEDCVDTWKVKVGSQYFPELVVIGLKHGVPMLRGGKSGDGKMRTMEISLAIKEWALSVAPVMREYEDKYSHVEPTGAGVPRIDFSASSSLCKWYFPLIMYATFSPIVKSPIEEFVYD